MLFKRNAPAWKYDIHIVNFTKKHAKWSKYFKIQYTLRHKQMERACVFVEKS